LSQSYPDIAKKLVKRLHEEFKEFQASKDTNKFESKIKNIRYLGELFKFRLIPAERALDLLEILLGDFTGQNVDLACQLLVTCGRFLYRLPDTRERLAFMLERLQRLKRAKKLPSEIEEQIDYAYFACRPPRTVKVTKEKPAEYTELVQLLGATTKDNFERTVRAVAALPPSPFFEKAVFKSLKHGKYSQVYLLADLLCQLHKPSGRMSEVRSILNSLQTQILSQLAVNDFRMCQQRILLIRFLGEVYIFRLLTKQKVLDLLYAILYSSPETDFPDDCFRLKLICSLLEVCGTFLFSGRYRAMFERFVVHLLAHVYKRTKLSQDVEFMLLDLFDKLRIRTRVPREDIDAALSRAVERDRNEVRTNDSDSDEAMEEGKAEENRDFEETKEVQEDEDAMFDQEYEQMVKYSLEEAKKADRPSDRELPGFVFNSSPKRSNTEALEFKLLVKKGSKTAAKKLAVPQDSRLVHQAKARQQQAEEDRRALSQVISNLHARSQADDH
jgi:regulator of nonsense transcripts 2